MDRDRARVVAFHLDQLMQAIHGLVRQKVSDKIIDHGYPLSRCAAQALVTWREFSRRTGFDFGHEIDPDRAARMQTVFAKASAAAEKEADASIVVGP